MKLGIGRWVQILETGLLPGKLIQQLNGQTQRLLGQQSLAAYTGLQVDIDRIRIDNETRTDAPRKAGLIINTGGTNARINYFHSKFLSSFIQNLTHRLCF